MLNMRHSSLKNWVSIIAGRDPHPSRLGFFCTRQPDDQDRINDITHAEARAKEVAFFEDTEPWKGSTHKRRLGTGPLVETLSRQLVDVIDETYVFPVTSHCSRPADVHILWAAVSPNLAWKHQNS